MIIKMMITFDYDPENNTYTPVKQEIVKENTKVKEEAKKAEESSEPQLTLDTNKYILNTAAAELLGVQADDRLDIKYMPLDNSNKTLYPIIGNSDKWGNSKGNKLTKSLTVSCRGNANELLAGYGDTFSFTPWQGHEGLFVLIGNADRPEPDNNIEIVESTEPAEDNPDMDYNLEEDFNQEMELDADASTNLDDVNWEL